jgi:hypothetical protein
MNISARTLFAFIAGCMPALVAAQEAAPAPETPVAAAAVAPADPGPGQGYVRLPANTPVDLEIAGALSSKTSKIDEMFPIRLRSAIMVDGKIVVPAGTAGQGQIVHAAKARAMGKAGELILAARYLDCGDLHITLRGFRLGEVGKDNSGAIVAAVAVGGLVAAPLMFVSGGESIISPGAPGHARLMSQVDVRTEPAPICVAPTAEAAPMAAVSSVSPDAAKAAPVSVQSK